ncbi:MAG: ABC transporter permease [Planctomycetes bacterium]|nr:ABC transporter permease [Planctomycetota bacterium]
MSWVDLLRLAFGALSKQKRRTFLSLLGVAIGVTAVLILTALGEGARGYVANQFEAFGTQVVAVLPGHTETSGGIPGIGGAPNDLTVDDARAIQRGVPFVHAVSPIAAGTETLSSGERSRSITVLGATNEVMRIRNLELRTGLFLPAGPWDRGEPVLVLSSKLARELFPGRSPLGEPVRLGDFRLRVIGVLQPQGVHLGVNMEETVFVPVATALRLFDKSSLFRIALALRSPLDEKRVTQRCRAILMERHGEEDFTIVTQEAMLNSLSSILNALTIGLVMIALISLTVAGIGILNVMLVSVSERSREIGLLKAIGALPRQVLALFLAEAVMLTAAGCTVGIAGGLGLAALVRRNLPDFPARVPPWVLLAVLVLAFGFGLVFGLLPARRAMRLAPVDALAGRM